MVTILIKSFNRPHYLDRCLKSILDHVKGDFEIKIIDDGTPQKYVEKIQEKFPHATFIYTRDHAEKSAQISSHETIRRSIPSKDWYNAVTNSTDYILVIEDDVWFTASIDFNEVINEMKQFEISLVKLGWNGIQNAAEAKSISKILKNEKPKFFTLNKNFMDILFADKFRIYSILKKLNVIDRNEFFKYYHFISITSGIHKKEYWLKTWENLEEKINEKLQIKNAIAYYKTNKTENFIAKFHQEIIKTTFKSSSTNSGHNYGVDLDINYLNSLLNEAWYHDEFDSMQNYPEDFSTEYFEQFFDEKLNKKEFRKWIEKFQEQYRNLGAQVD